MGRLLDDPLPDGVFAPEEAAIVRYARKATRMQPIDDATYGDLERHFTKEQIIDLCLTVGASNMVNRFHATFRTDVDADTLAEVEAGNEESGVCPIPLPGLPIG
jgi:alkylhydroperoxidase family enzyme